MSLGADPYLIFKEWMETAEKAGVIEPNAMVISTIDEQGQPDSRVVLLKRTIDGVFYFFTNYNSPKSRQLLKNPVAALNFHWRFPVSRQVRIKGTVMKASAEISDEYYSTRSRGSRIGAWSSPQSQPIENRKVLEDLVKSFEEKFADREIPRPEFWGGFGIRPTSIEFWEDGQYRLHTRWKYVKDGDTWKASMYAP
ncbi:MAG: pyridoxamine 5'-phosphate oxidase [Bdellovibrionales bacterium]|nr:pyridoxamine 5'-phosphate oxidase [Bdellovibrionales bacterium]